MRVVINGAGIAGPTLAWWLRKAGHEVVLVEAAPGLRRGGFVVDFWGCGYDVAEKMGLLPALHDVAYATREVRFVDAHGRRCGGFAVDAIRRATGGRYTALRRSDLSAAIYGALDPGVERIFGNSIARLEHHGEFVGVHFEHGPPREADLVVGADGLHSRVRQLAFGPDAQFEKALGYHVAAVEIAGYRPRDELMFVGHSVPGRQVSRFALRDDRTLFLFIFRDEFLAGVPSHGELDARTILSHVFEGVGWECPRILAALPGGDSIYLDSVSQIRMKSWTGTRTALVGDAGACVSLMAGEGTGLAMTEAYVLAGELGRCGGDMAAAFAQYERLMMPLLARKQAAAERFSSSTVPRTALGIRFRDAVTAALRFGPVADLFLGRALRDDIALPDY